MPCAPGLRPVTMLAALMRVTDGIHGVMVVECDALRDERREVGHKRGGHLRGLQAVEGDYQDVSHGCCPRMFLAARFF